MIQMLPCVLGFVLHYFINHLNCTYIERGKNLNSENSLTFSL